jgi:hypothetical protein
MSKCVGSNLSTKGCWQNLVTIDNVGKVHQKIWDKGCQYWGPSPKRWPTSTSNKHILDVPHVDDPKTTKRITKDNKLVPSSDQDTSITIGSI